MPSFLKKQEDSFHSKVHFYSVNPLSLQAFSMGVVGREERGEKKQTREMELPTVPKQKGFCGPQVH